jgi:hydrogenase maturation protease
LDDTSRIIVACVGNVLRGDDGFGCEVASRLHDLPDGAEVLETGIGGMTLVQELMGGCAGLIVVDAIDRGAAPGTLFLIEPEIAEPRTVADIHLANPDAVLAMAKGLGCLPQRVLLVGCQQGDVDELSRKLTPPVQAAVPVAAARVRETLETWLATGPPR